MAKSDCKQNSNFQIVAVLITERVGSEISYLQFACHIFFNHPRHVFAMPMATFTYGVVEGPNAGEHEYGVNTCHWSDSPTYCSTVGAMNTA